MCSFDTYGPLFKQNGIQLDSSVIIGASMNSRFQVYNYKTAPIKSLYYYYDDICKEVNETDNNKFIEMPISHSDRMLSIIYLIKKRRMTSELFPWKQYGDGIGVASKLTFAQRYKDKIAKLFGKMRFGGSIDYFQSLALWRVYEDCKRRGDRNMVILGHPKLTTDKALVNVKKFVDDMIQVGNEFHTLDEVVINKDLRYGA